MRRLAQRFAREFQEIKQLIERLQVGRPSGATMPDIADRVLRLAAARKFHTANSVIRHYKNNVIFQAHFSGNAT
jgi:hypothetical protein